MLIKSCGCGVCEWAQQLSGSWLGVLSRGAGSVARHASLLLSIARPPNLSPVLDPVLPTAETQRCAQLYTHSCFTLILLFKASSGQPFTLAGEAGGSEALCWVKEDKRGGCLVVLQKRVPEVEIKSDRARIDCWAGGRGCTAHCPTCKQASSEL